MGWKRLLWRAYLVLLHLALVFFVAKSATFARAAASIGLRGDPDNGGVTWLHEVHKQQDATVPAGAAIFLGDSHFQRLATAAVAPLSVNYGIGGLRSDQLLRMMDDLPSLARASRVFISIGTNDVRAGQQEGIGQRYREILAKVPAGVPVVLSSLFPMAEADTQQVVEAGRSACAARPGCRFVDAYATITLDMLDDGVHLNAQGYRAWVQMLRQATRTAPRSTDSRSSSSG